VTNSDPPPGSQGPNASFRQSCGEPAELFVRAARYHDLVVLAGGERPGRQLVAADIGRILLQSGRPVLLAADEPLRAVPKTIAIAWKSTAEAAHAVSAAMPILAQAHRVVVLIANEDDAAALDCLDCTDSVVQQLRWHGISAHARYVIPAGRTAAVALRDTSREVGADLMVMGAYGHGRLAAIVFGGVTHEMLKGGDIAVLMCH
jgi:nucleotide-binding universal stress UspA family protein